jgi:carboxymethylenebutenolidase
MIEKRCNIRTAEGLMGSFITYPRQGDPLPVVLFYMDSLGVREELREMARRIAAAGYYVLLPDLYYRQPAENGRKPRAEGPDDIGHRPHPLEVGAVMLDTAAMLAYLDAQPEADARRVGAVGYCMSGAFVLAAAGTFPDRFKCAASIYGVDLLTQGADSPHLLADRVRGELYFASAEFDEYVPAGMMAQLDAHLRECGTNHRLDLYPGTRHGFAFPERTEAYDRESAERHWACLLALFHRNLYAASA